MAGIALFIAGAKFALAEKYTEEAVVQSLAHAPETGERFELIDGGHVHVKVADAGSWALETYAI